MKYVKYLLVVVLSAILLPNALRAEEKIDLSKYNSLDLKATLQAEEMEEQFTSYQETDDQVTIYLFRGQGCGYCRAFITFLNSITEEYGQYFKLRSFEVWYDDNNNSLLNKTATFLGQAAGGVPYIVIGDQVFPGYVDSYDEAIKDAIMTEFNKAKKERYDVFAEYNKSIKDTSALSGKSIALIVIFNILAVATATVVIVANQNKKYLQLMETVAKKK